MSRHRIVRVLVRLVLLATALAGVQLFFTSTTAAADPSHNDWARLRMCESSNRYDINTGNGYYGAYQFDLSTWQSVKGGGYPHQAAPGEQDYRALYLYRMRGWQPWECARMLGLAPDADARSNRVPTYTDSAYIGGNKPTPPPWPGKTYTLGQCDTALIPWQQRMISAYHYTFKADGCYHKDMLGAALQLQKANNIQGTGGIGPKTWVAAWTGRPPR